MNKKIPLNKGLFAIVDDEDYEYLNQRKWFAKKCRNTHYVYSSIHKRDGEKVPLIMHRVLLNVKDTETFVDHIDGNGLNNQKSNLRLVNRQENSYNRKKNKNSRSKYKGLSWVSRVKLWRVRIIADKKEINIGYFKNEKDAAEAYNEAALRYHGKFARLNKV